MQDLSESFFVFYFSDKEISAAGFGLEGEMQIIIS